MTLDGGQYRSRLRRALDQFPYLPRAFALVWHSARGWTLLWGGLLVAQGLLPAAAVLLLRAMVDAMVAVAGSGMEWSVVRRVLEPGALLGAVLLLQEILRGASSWVRTAQGLLVQDHIAALVHRQSVALDLGFYDSPDYYDHLHRARDDARHRPTALIESAGALLQSGITLVAMASVLATYAWWVPLILVLSTAPALFVVLRYTVREHDWEVRNTSRRRKAWYYDHLLTARDVAAELRLFDLGPYFINRFQSIRQRLRIEQLGLLKSQALSGFFAGLMGLVAMGGAMLWMVARVAQGSASLGDVVLFYQAFTQGQGLMRALLENVGQIYRNLLFIGNLFEFLSLEPRVVEADRPEIIELPLRGGIRFRDVTFHYPEARRAVFQRFSLDIPAGQIVSIVGTNGAGKSTLIKLLCRFYDPQSGCVELDGKDLRQISISSLRSAVAVLFQQPVHFQETVAENIAFGDFGAQPSSERVERAARDSGADRVVAGLAGGYGTQLGKWFEGGTDLSVGEWQRIGLARALLRRSAVLVLDEPTSAMDPWAEAEWLGRLRQIAEGKTTIIITHRFTTAMVADTINVMDEGKIIESGSHRDLLALDGCYAQSWKAQIGSAPVEA